LQVGDTYTDTSFSEGAPMANREVNLTKRVQTWKGMRYCPVVLSANGRVKPDVVLVNGQEERHTEGAYYLEWRDGFVRHPGLPYGCAVSPRTGQP
jgi:hypothetical protein